MTTLAQYLDPQVIQQVSRLDLRARFIIEGFMAGLHRSLGRGLSIEFSEHRKYAQGDDLRTIDWNVFARTDRLYVRQYHAETHLPCYLLVDISASMGYVGLLEPQGQPSPQPAAKLMYAIHLAAALGYLIVQQQDAVGLGLLGSRLARFLPARGRRQHLLHLLTTLAGIRPAGETGLAASIDAALARIPHRGLVVLLSDLLTDAEDLHHALQHIRYRGHDLIVMHILDAAEARFELEGALRLEDPETGAMVVADAGAVRKRYAAALEDWRERLRQRLAALKADYVPLDTSVPFDKALVEFLLQRSRRR